MNRSSEQIVRETLAKVIGTDRSWARDGQIAGQLDSFAMVELTAELEVAFGIVVPVERLGGPDFNSVSTLAAMCTGLKSR